MRFHLIVSSLAMLLAVFAFGEGAKLGSLSPQMERKLLMDKRAASMKGCSMSSLNKCYGSLPPDGSTPSHLLEEIGQIPDVQTCQSFCRDLYNGTCEWFMFDRTTNDCKMFSGSLDALRADCKEVGYAKDPDHSSCDVVFESDSENGCYNFREDYCRFEFSLLENLEDIETLSECQLACEYINNCTYFMYDNPTKICKLNTFASSRPDCDIVHGTPEPDFNSCVNDGHLDWASNENNPQSSSNVVSPVDCEWGDYGEWSTCSKDCGGGEKTRSRSKATEASNGGQECQGDATETDTCNPDACPVDCVWGNYGEWSDCSKTCGGGEKTRSRSKATEASNGGQECQGEPSETANCSEDACPETTTAAASGGAEVLYRSVPGNEEPNYSEDCTDIPSDAVYMKLVMGTAVDYFKPVAGRTYCEMLQSHSLHQWSSDGVNWETPPYYNNHLGGSAGGFPPDGRQYLSFWGGNGGGGCCRDGFGGGGGDWGKAFVWYYKTAGGEEDNSSGGCNESGNFRVTNQASFESLPSTTDAISEAYCVKNEEQVDCSGDVDHMPSAGFEIHGPHDAVGSLDMKFAGDANVVVEYGREDAWNENCPVELLKNGNVLSSVTNGEGDSKNQKTRTSTTVSSGDVLSVREGVDGSICGVHLYGVEISCAGGEEDNSSGSCSDGDVELKADGTPLYFFDGGFRPICGHHFWNNQNGATFFCQKLGYSSGSLNAVRGKYQGDAIEVGECRNGESISTCSGGGKNYEMTDWCAADRSVSITITCDGHTPNTAKATCTDPLSGYFLGAGTCSSVCSAKGLTCDMEPLYGMTKEWCTENWNKIEGGQGQECTEDWAESCDLAAGGWADPPRQGSTPCQLEGNGRLWYYENKDKDGNGLGTDYLNCDHAYFTSGLSVCYCN